MLSGDVIRNREAEARPTVSGSKERIENLFEPVWRYAAACVQNRDLYPSWFVLRSRRLFERRVHGERAALLHCLKRVEHKVEENLFELQGIAGHVNVRRD